MRVRVTVRLRVRVRVRVRDSAPRLAPHLCLGAPPMLLAPN